MKVQNQEVAGSPFGSTDGPSALAALANSFVGGCITSTEPPLPTVTVKWSTSPARWTSMSTSLPMGVEATASSRLRMVSTGWPSNLRIMSLGFRPATSAGPPGATLATRAPTGSCNPMLAAFSPVTPSKLMSSCFHFSDRITRSARLIASSRTSSPGLESLKWRSKTIPPTFISTRRSIRRACTVRDGHCSGSPLKLSAASVSSVIAITATSGGGVEARP